jgi:hypothetical protein
MAMNKVINHWTLQRLELAQGLKEHVLPVVGLDTVMLIAEYATDTIDRFLTKGNEKHCCYYNCGASHRRRISNLCKKHEDSCVVCLTGHTKNNKRHICADCAVLPASDYYKDLLKTMPVHDVFTAMYGRKKTFNDWIRKMEIQWNGPFLLRATPENQDMAMGLIEDSMFLIPTWVVSGLSEEKYGVTFTKRSRANLQYDMEDFFSGKLIKHFNQAVKEHNESVNAGCEESS